MWNTNTITMILCS